MERALKNILNGEVENYILPFFWQHGETEEKLREYMHVIHDCGIGAVCVECRPHPDFCGPKWWADLDAIMDEARKLNMRVWLLDDAHFPTGFANGAFADAADDVRRKYVNAAMVEVYGPMPDAMITVGEMGKYKPTFSPYAAPHADEKIFGDDTILSVVAAKFDYEETFSELIDLTDKVQDGILYWDIPAGAWRIFVMYNTKNGGGRIDYMSLINEKSVRVLIDEVYEKHYERYSADFGKTFAGFFSDEPSFGNTTGYGFDESIGRKKMPLPWTDKVSELMQAQLGENWKGLLPLLWAQLSDEDLTANVRYAYMNAVTQLVSENFSNQIGSWCSEHGVEYIGHVIEDSDQHTRLGCGTGHYFRALSGQHMAGIDDIGDQVIPGADVSSRVIWTGKEIRGEFFHYALGKLASSHAHIDPKKKGRAMCEIYGAYGWRNGVRPMKYITDHFLVRGVNHYVPHAFSPKEFPDPDCPPHFYANGRNPQYRHFAAMMKYLNRACNLLNGGRHIPAAAILYNAESEWTGESMTIQKPGRALIQSQIDFDFIPSDVFEKDSEYNTSFDGALHVNTQTYKALVIPAAQYITEAVARFAASASEAGFPVVFVDTLPQGICNADSKETADTLIAALAKCDIATLDTLPELLKAKNIPEITLKTPNKNLSYYHYLLENDIFMFMNESIIETVDTEVLIPINGEAVAYDAFENTLRPLDYSRTDGGISIKLHLEPYESIFVVFGAAEGEAKAYPNVSGATEELGGEWEISFATALEYPNFSGNEKITKLENLARRYPNFSGTVRYTKTANLADAKTLELSDLFDAAEVWVNGSYAGMRICPPYRFDISNLVKAGENTIQIEVTNTPDREVAAMDVPGLPRGSAPFAPTGIIGSVKIYK